MLKENGYSVEIAARDNLAEKNGLQIKGADKIFDLPFDRSPTSKNNILAYRELKEIIDKNSYDIIHCNTPIGGAITRLASLKSRKKGSQIFYLAHGFHFYKGGPKKNWFLYYPIEKFLARHTDKLITINKEDYQLAREKFKSKIYQVHGMGGDSEKYYPHDKEKTADEKENLDYAKEDFILLSTGELNKNKNQTTLIKAMRKIKLEEPHIKLLIAGNGPMEKELKDLVKKLELEDSVHFLGYRRDLERYVNISDLIVSASHREGLGLNLLEAMLCQKAIIASDNRGHRELLEEGRTGYLVKADDAEAFAKRILQVYRDPDHRQALAKAGKKASTHFTVEKVLEEFKKIYEVEI